jgi:excisionase family DNA binding protein
MAGAWMTLEEVCDEIGVSRSTIDKWRAKGKGPAWRRLPSGRLRIRRQDLDAWLDALPEVA